MHTQNAPYKCHLFVCTNVRENSPDNPGCGVKTGPMIKDDLKEAVNTRGWKGKVRVSTSGCLGLCAQGPNILLYPQGLWFSNVTEADLDTVLNTVEKYLR